MRSAAELATRDVPGVAVPGPRSALDVALRRPDTLPVGATLEDVRRFFRRSEKIHLALVVDNDGRLLTTILRDDLNDATEGGLAATQLGALSGRTVSSTHPAHALGPAMDSAGQRRLAVVDSVGRLVGLVCRKSSRAGFCSDEGVEARRATM